MLDGTFGLAREIAIANSKVRDIFTPYSPINIKDHFFGREKEVSQMVSVVNSPGQHVLLYGDRGVGKTSLATIACRLITQSKISHGKFFSKRCCSEDTFASVMYDPLRYVSIDYEITEKCDTHAQGGDARLKIVVAEGGVKSTRSRVIKRVPRNQVESPSWVAERLHRVKGLFLIDEADALGRKTDRKRIAELIKLLSDSASEFKIMVVGIADTGEDLTAGHLSVERCLKETHLSRMPPEALRGIILNGMNSLKLVPEDEVVDKIVDISAGYPHFTHLICLKCAENAIVAKRKHITRNCLDVALRDAVEESEGALKRCYENTLRGVKHDAEYRLILAAAAHCAVPEFKISVLRETIDRLLGVPITSTLVTRYMSNMIACRNKGVFVRVGKGVYRFADPRMPSFIKMVQAQNKN